MFQDVHVGGKQAMYFHWAKRGQDFNLFHVHMPTTLFGGEVLSVSAS